MYKRILAVVFDMDGLIFDTEKVYKYAWKTAGKQVGYPIEDILYNRFIGLSTESCEKILKEEFSKHFPLKEFRELWIRLRRDKIENEGITFKKGFKKLFQFLKDQKIKVALATSSPQEDVDLNFKATSYLQDFASIVTEEKVNKGKPHPEIFQTTAKNLGIKTDEMIVLEDSNNGMRAAIAAKTIAIMVPDMLPPEDDVKKNAYKIISSLNDVINLPIIQNQIFKKN
jgi:HAD superfamily hydrolase (TIGR01509 family)